jgi:hypothetical protein
MSDIESKPIESIENDDFESKPIRPKRVMSEKQLENLSKARQKAKITLMEKKKRSTTLKQQERKLRELKLKDKEDRIQAELNSIQNTVNIQGDIQDEPVIYKKKPRKKKPTKIIYYSSSDGDDELEEEAIVYKKKVRKPRPRANFQTIPTMEEADKKVEDAAIEKKYNDELIRMRRQYMMDQVFPK